VNALMLRHEVAELARWRRLALAAVGVALLMALIAWARGPVRIEVQETGAKTLRVQLVR
jgi:hypothetical protein